MKTIKEMFSSKFFILFMLFLIGSFLLYVKDVNAWDKLPQEFPDLSYLYNGLDAYLEKNPKYVETLKHLIEKLDATNYKYVIYLQRNQDSASNYQIFVSLAKEEFYIKHRDNSLRYTTSVSTMGNGSIYMSSDKGNIDRFYLDVNSGETELTNEHVDEWVNCFVTHSDLMFSKSSGTLSFLNKNYFQPTSSYQYFYTIFFHSNMDKKGIDVKDYAGFDYSILNGKMYGYFIPTFSSVYTDYGIGREITKDNSLEVKDENDSKNVEVEDKDVDDLDFSSGIENTNNMDIVKVWINKLLKHFPIYNQIVEIKKAFEYHGTDGKCIWFSVDDKVFYDICVPKFEFKFNVLGMNIEGSAIDLSFYAKYRSTVFFYMRLLIYSITVFGALHVLSEFFK